MQAMFDYVAEKKMIGHLNKLPPPFWYAICMTAKLRNPLTLVDKNVCSLKCLSNIF